ncbi:MAG: FIST signal transduction protein [Synechococcus sp.]
MATFSPFNWLRSPQREPSCRTALSVNPSLEAAVQDVSAQLRQARQSDLALVFASTSYASDLPRLLPLLQQRLKADTWLGCVGGGVVGTNQDGRCQELEQKPALSVTLLSLPGATIKATALDTATLPDLDGAAQTWEDWVGIKAAQSRSQIVLLDPSSSGINDLISGLDYAYPEAAKIGGIAAPHNAAHGSLLLNDQVINGAVVCSIGGDWLLDTVVAQGCRPIGPVFSIEQVQRNVLLELNDGERKASPVACLQRVLAELTDEERDRARHSLFLGIERRTLRLSADGQQSKDDGAFLVRNLIGVDPSNGAVAVAERVRPGQNVQFQLREANASRDEALELLKAAADGGPQFGLLMACLGRGQSLFGVPDGDVSIAREVMPDLPVAGAFCNGEIGPVGGATHLHGYTACWGLLRPVDATDG